MDKVEDELIDSFRLVYDSLMSGAVYGSKGELASGTHGLVVATNLFLNKELGPVLVNREAKLVNPFASAISGHSEVSVARVLEHSKVLLFEGLVDIEGASGLIDDVRNVLAQLPIRGLSRNVQLFSHGTGCEIVNEGLGKEALWDVSELLNAQMTGEFRWSVITLSLGNTFSSGEKEFRFSLMESGLKLVFG
jgi:hypothetical protein